MKVNSDGHVHRRTYTVRRVCWHFDATAYLRDSAVGKVSSCRMLEITPVYDVRGQERRSSPLHLEFWQVKHNINYSPWKTTEEEGAEANVGCEHQLLLLLKRLA